MQERIPTTDHHEPALRGFSAFLTHWNLGLGGCLADDMSYFASS